MHGIEQQLAALHRPQVLPLRLGEDVQHDSQLCCKAALGGKLDVAWMYSSTELQTEATCVWQGRATHLASLMASDSLQGMHTVSLRTRLRSISSAQRDVLWGAVSAAAIGGMQP
jgi:hypothetical protein